MSRDDVYDAAQRAQAIMLDTADWLEETAPAGTVRLNGFTGDHQLLVCELRRAAGVLNEVAHVAPATG